MFAVFALWGWGHCGVIATIGITAALLVLVCRKGSESKSSKVGVSILAFFCFASYPLNQLVMLSANVSPQMDAILPLHLCDLAAFLCGFALITRRPLLCELSYFWGLAGTMQGLLTPNLSYPFPHPMFISFFLQHGVIVITAILLPLGLGWRPRQGAALAVFMWVMLYAVGALAVNSLLGTNFGFLSHKPAEVSLLDLMPRWPWYIFCLITLSGIFFYLLALPFKRR